MFDYSLTDKNKYYNLYSLIREDILGGVLKAGERLPSKRALARDLGVSVITVQTAYEQLLAEGYVLSYERRGYFVAEVNIGKNAHTPPVFEPVKRQKRYDLNLVTGIAPAELFPFSVWAKLMRATLSEEGEHLLERVPCDGDAQLKSSVAAYLYRARGLKVDPQYVVIGAGAEYLYGIIVQLLGREREYAVENPGYDAISHTYALNGAKCVYVPVGENGVDCSAVEGTNACALHVSPSHQYPTGAVMPAANRARLIKWADGADAYIIEDDYDSEFRLFGKPLQAMAGMNSQRVIYLNTFSKTLAPSMRMGYMVLPPALYARFIEMFGGSANVVPLFEQKTLSKMLDGGYFERHVNRLKGYYRTVREKLLAAIKGLPFCGQVIETGGGLHVTLELAGFASDGEIKAKAQERGIYVKCLSDYLLAPAKGYGGVAVINYSGVTTEQLEGAIRALKETGI